MELIAAVVLAGPLGYLVRRRRTSLIAYLAAWVVIFPVQTVVVRDDGHLEWSYFVVNAGILALALGLNHAGRRLRARRASSAPPIVPSAGART